MKLDLPPSLWPVVHLSAAKEGWPPSCDEAADRLVAQAGREGLLPLLFEDGGLPPVVTAALDRHRAWQPLAARRAEILLQALDSVADLLGEEPFVLLKGADYMRRLYPRPDLRPMQDVDLLVPRARIDAVCRRLREGGLNPRPVRRAEARVASYYERAFTLGDVVVEVHHSFVQRVRHRIDYDAVWERRVPWEGSGRGAARLCDVDALAAHALAMAKDEFSVPLVRYVDLWLMLRPDPGLLEGAAQRAREWKAVRALYGALRQACRMLPELRTAEREAVAGRLLSAPVRSFLDRWVLPGIEEQGRAGVVTRPLQLWRKFWLMDDLPRRIGFGLYHGYAVIAGGRLARREGGRGTEGA